MTAAIEFLGPFSFTEDPPPAASDEVMRLVLGPTWDSTQTRGEVVEIFNKALQPLGYEIQFAGTHYQRVPLDGRMEMVETGFRNTAQFIYERTPH